MSEEDLEPLLAYLREHSRRYSLEALRDQLLAAGHAPETADRAIAVFQAQSPPPEKPAWPVALLVALVNFVVPAGCIALLAQIESDMDGPAAFLLLAPLVLFLAELIGGIVLLATGRRRLGKGLLFGLVLSIGLGIVAIGVFCLYAYSQL